MNSSVTLIDGMAFDVELEGHHFTIDAKPASGGADRGPTPKGLLLSSLAGCTAMDVRHILKKMRQEVRSLKVSADGVLSEEHPRRFVEITVTYEVAGEIKPERLERAVELSERSFCGVSATLTPTVKLKNRILLNGELLPTS